MDIFKQLNIKPVRTEPDVWISRLVIFEAIAPAAVFIQDIPLTRGLNIIWAEEIEDDDPQAEMTGHSAGKTTFCRLLRYVLGEKTYGTRSNTELMQNALPNAYVAAEIHVNGKKWSVLRPIGKGRNSYIKPEATVEELLQDRTTAAYSETYVQKIGLERLLDSVEAGDIVKATESIDWGHILAWCTRDQEARFQNIYDWRSPRSESEAPAFRSLKAGPLFVMRAVLGLFLPDELRGEENLTKLKQENDSLSKQIEKLKQEPQFRVNLYDGEVRKRLRKILPNEPDIENLPLHSDKLFFDLTRLLMKTKEEMQVKLDELEKDGTDLQNKIDFLTGMLLQEEKKLGIHETLYAKDQAVGQELNAGVSKHKKDLDLFEKHSEEKCILGGILYSDCDYVQKRIQVLQIADRQDARAMKEAEAKRIEAQRIVDEEKRQVQEEIKRISKEQGELQTKRNKLTTSIQDMSAAIKGLKQAFEDLEKWTKIRDESGSYKELDDCRSNLEKSNSQIQDLEQHLTTLLKEHSESRILLSKIFSAAVRSVLASGTYDGKVSLEKRQLGFSITHGPSMSGEAVETLSVLLTDLTSLIYNSVSENSHLPGFLLHDSPREADLGLRIYRSYIRFAASLQAHFNNRDQCPFQYILTTTTAPPKELRNKNFVKLRLNAAQPSGMLLGRTIGTEIADETASLPL